MAMAATIPYYTVEEMERFPRDGNRYELLDGVLLVTPAPSYAHQAVATVLAMKLALEVQGRGIARVLAPGAVAVPPRTQLEPDVLVVPLRFALNSQWQDITEHWLAVEILSRSSRMYDREFKRDAYLQLGVREVWLVDLADRSVEVSRLPGASKTVRDTLAWQVPAHDLEVQIQLAEVFAGLE